MNGLTMIETLTMKSTTRVKDTHILEQKELDAYLLKLRALLKLEQLKTDTRAPPRVIPTKKQ